MKMLSKKLVGVHFFRLLKYQKFRYCKLNNTGFGRVQIETIIAVMFVLINVFSETMGISNLIPAAECDLQLNESTKGLLSSMPFFGTV